MKTIVRVAALLAAAVLADAAPAQAAEQRDPRLAAALRSFVAREGGPPAAVVIIQKGERRTVYSAGLAALDCGPKPRRCADVRPPRVTDHMRLASVSKAFSGAAALRLVTGGRLGLDDTIGERLPDLPRQWHAVTLRQLLNHTSGLPDFTESRAFAARITADPVHAPPPRDLLMFVAREPLNFPPGSRYRYSNSDNIAVGLMVEAVTGRGYSAFLQETVFGPLRMRRTSLGPNYRMPRPFMHGYLWEDGRAVDESEIVDLGGYAWASGGIVSSPADMSRFVRAYVGGALFGPREQRQQARFVPGGESGPPGPGRNAAGLGLFRYATRCGTVYGHTGNAFGYTQFMAASRDGTRSVTTSITMQITRELLPALRRIQELAVCIALSD